MSTDTPTDAVETSAQDSAADDWAQALEEQASSPGKSADGESAPEFESISSPAKPSGNPASQNDIQMVLDIPVQLTVELGRTKVPIKYILQLAQGEVVVVNEKFGIRLTDIVTPSERMRRVSRG